MASFFNIIGQSRLNLHHSSERQTHTAGGARSTSQDRPPMYSIHFFHCVPILGQHKTRAFNRKEPCVRYWGHEPTHLMKFTLVNAKPGPKPAAADTARDIETHTQVSVNDRMTPRAPISSFSAFISRFSTGPFRARKKSRGNLGNPFGEPTSNLQYSLDLRRLQ